MSSGSDGISDRATAERAKSMSLDICLATRPANWSWNRDHDSYLVAHTGYTWRKHGDELHIRFLNGDPQLHAKVEEISKEWMEYANIRFLFDNDPTAKIRISFRLDDPWSAIGRQCEAIEDEPTMYLPSTDDGKLKGVVLHEFGHVLGCIHEHQSPEAGIPWNIPEVYKYYGERGWSHQKVDEEVLTPAQITQTNYSEFDPKSIMIYPIPGKLTDGRLQVNWNSELSQTDKDWIRKVYP